METPQDAELKAYAEYQISVPAHHAHNELDHLDHSVVIPAKYYAQQSVAHCAALASRYWLALSAVYTLCGFAGVSLHVLIKFLAVCLAVYFGHKLPFKYHQNAVYCKTNDTVIVDCQTTQDWNKTRYATAEITLGSICGVAVASQLCFVMNDWTTGLLAIANFIGFLLYYFYQLKTSSQRFQKALKAGIEESDGIHFTIESVNTPKKAG